jgi:UDP-N-acetylmuramoyl-tripeptide--D-alanyl-D-alanine ligase
MAIDVLAEQKGKQVFVMGDMAELGESAQHMHAEIGTYAKQKGIHKFLSFGKLSKFSSENFGAGGKHFNALEALLEELRIEMKEDLTILVKGSRFMKMERVISAITKEKSFMEAH